MHRAPKITLIFGLLVLLVINIVAFAKRHDGTMHPLDSTEVSVYPPEASGVPPALPIVEISDRKPDSPCKNVMVFIHYSYDDKLAKATPLLSLITICFTFILYFIESKILRRQSRAA